MGYIMVDETDPMIRVEIDVEKCDLREFIELMEGVRALFFRALLAQEENETKTDGIDRLRESYVDFTIQQFDRWYPMREFSGVSRPYGYVYSDESFRAWLRTVREIDVQIISMSAGSVIFEFGLGAYVMLSQGTINYSAVKDMTYGVINTIKKWSSRPSMPNTLDRVPSILKEAKRNKRIKKLKVSAKHDSVDVTVDFFEE